MTKEQQWNFDHRQSDAPLQWTLADRGLKEATISKDAQLSSTISDVFTLQQTQQDDSWGTSLQNESWRSLHGLSFHVLSTYNDPQNNSFSFFFYILINQQVRKKKNPQIGIKKCIAQTK